MPNDAKLGLVAGVAVVILIAVVFFRKDTAQAEFTATPSPPPRNIAPEPPAAPRTIPPPPTAPPVENDNPMLLPPPPALPDPPQFDPS